MVNYVRIKARTLEEAKKKAKDKYGIYVAFSSGKLIKKAKKKGAMNEYAFKMKKNAGPAKMVKISTGKKYKNAHHNTGPMDAKRPALPPGKRISKNGNVYYEYRPNRSDWPVTRKVKKVSPREAKRAHERTKIHRKMKKKHKK